MTCMRQFTEARQLNSHRLNTVSIIYIHIIIILWTYPRTLKRYAAIALKLQCKSNSSYRIIEACGRPLKILHQTSQITCLLLPGGMLVSLANYIMIVMADGMNNNEYHNIYRRRKKCTQCRSSKSRVSQRLSTTRKSSAPTDYTAAL